MSRSGFTVGCSVVLSHDYSDYGDARNGPLKPGDAGRLIKDDGSSVPFHESTLAEHFGIAQARFGLQAKPLVQELQAAFLGNLIPRFLKQTEFAEAKI
jgi:hypothetical protein